MHMYHTKKVEIPEYFRAELSHFMLGMREAIGQYIHNRGVQCEVGKYPRSFPIYRIVCMIVYSWSNPENVFPRSFLTMESYLMYEANNNISPYVRYFDRKYVFWWFIFHRARKTNGGWIGSHLEMCTTTTRIQWFTQWMKWKCIFLRSPWHYGWY